MIEISLEDWLVSTEEKRSELLAYSRSPIPTDPGERSLDISVALQHGQDAGDLLADADKHVTDETGKQVLQVRLDHSELNGTEREKIVKGRVSNVVRLRDGLHVIYTSIKDRRFTLMSVGRW